MHMNWQKALGIIACITVIISCFMHWAFYPDLQKFFTGFDSLVNYKGRMINYYGRPGFLLSFFAGLSLIFHIVPKNWAKRVNLIFGALCMATVIKSFLTFTSAYSGIVPEKQLGIYLLAGGAIVNLICVIFVKVQPVKTTVAE